MSRFFTRANIFNGKVRTRSAWFWRIGSPFSLEVKCQGRREFALFWVAVHTSYLPLGYYSALLFCYNLFYSILSTTGAHSFSPTENKQVYLIVRRMRIARRLRIMRNSLTRRNTVAPGNPGKLYIARISTESHTHHATISKSTHARRHAAETVTEEKERKKSDFIACQNMQVGNAHMRPNCQSSHLLIK